MRDSVKRFFESRKIEYFSLLEYSACREINGRLVSRAGITPRTVVLYLLPYFTEQGENISSYAVGIDYHRVINKINSELIELLRLKFPENKFLSFGDHSPIDERQASLISGLGISGESGLLINERYGSYVFIGEVVCDLELKREELTPLITPKKCIGCGKCALACPTGILRGEGTDCLSAITQKKGELSASELSLMAEYNTAWGCDICQRVCPYNRHPEKTPVFDFYGDVIPYLTRARLDTMENDEFDARAFAWRGRKTIERNLEFLENVNKS